MALCGLAAGGEFSAYVTTTYLKADPAEEFGSFGSSVAIDGDTMVVGFPGWDSDTIDRGSFGTAVVYVRDTATGEWREQGKLVAHNAEESDGFGGRVALSGDTVAVIAGGEDGGVGGINTGGSDNSEPHSGAAYVFVREGAKWIQQAYIKAPSPITDHNLGHAVALHEDTLVIADVRDSSDAVGVNGEGSVGTSPNAGAVYVYARSGTAWELQAYLKGSNTESSDYFGHSISVHGDYIAVGANGEGGAIDHDGIGTDNTLDGSGAVYVFKREGRNWAQQAYLKGSNLRPNDGFGSSVAIFGDTLAGGAPHEDDSTGNAIHNSGAAYAFRREGEIWQQEDYFNGDNTSAGDRFGSQMALHDGTLVVSAPRADGDATGVDGVDGTERARDSGSAYVFSRVDSRWRQDAFLKASLHSGSISERFGDSVSLSGGTIAIGLPNEEGDAVGINSRPSGGEVRRSGAAYVFEKVPEKSVYGIMSFEETDNGLRMEIPSITRCPVGVEYSPDLSEGSWIELGNFFFGLPHEPGVFTDPDTSRFRDRTRGFYRAFLR